MRAYLLLCSSARPLSPMLAAAVLLPLAGCQQDAESPTAPEPVTALATTATQVLAFSQVSAGRSHTCGLTTDNRAYCWGSNDQGQLGDGTTTQRLRPVPVGGGHQFRQVIAGATNSCGLTMDNKAYCWGGNSFGELGDGTTTRRRTPVAVVGGLKFHQLDADGSYTCGVSYSDRRAYCWGRNEYGHLGDGTTNNRTRPVPVAGMRQFLQVHAGNSHTCGIGYLDNRAYCWGRNHQGQLGDGTDAQRLTPVAVLGGHSFRQVSAGGGHTCAVTNGDLAYCWGWNAFGQSGDGSTIAKRFRPKAVAGGLNFRDVSAGENHSCGRTTLNRAYCWGENFGGQLGDGTGFGTSSTPVAVAGGKRFRQVDGGGSHTCGKTPTDVAYCWGFNGQGQIGDGTTDTRDSPVAVAGPM